MTPEASGSTAGEQDADSTVSRAVSSSEFYTQWAALYDRIASDAPFVAGVRTALADALDPDRGDVVVEMGCGTGANFPYLRDRVGSEGVVVGIDISEGVLTHARDRIHRHGWENVHVVRGDATQPPFFGESGVVADLNAERSVDPKSEWDYNPPMAAGEVDCVVGSFISGMVPDPAGMVDGWCDLVGDGGRVALLEMARSTTPVGRLLNPFFRLFVRAGAPPGTRSEFRSLAARLDRRVRDAHQTVHSRSVDARTDRLLLGFMRITAGTVGDETTSGSGP